MSTSALAGLDPLLNAPKRLAIMAVLATSTSTDFAFLREHLDISDSDLSKQASALEAAGYLGVTKRGRGRGAVTAYQATKAGKAAYQRHRAALRHLLAD
jgi:DNA-binding MarR family transcriptional regulator